MDRLDSPTRRHARRDQLALRMVRHGARSSTVSAWTGLSGNRIRTLLQHHGTAPPVRHRGQPPRRLGYFFRSVRLATHAAALGGLIEMLGVLPDSAIGVPAQRLHTIARGEALCQAYELYRQIVALPAIRFEHAVLLASALAEGEEVSLQECPQCAARVLVDHFGLTENACTHCRPSLHLPAIPGGASPTLTDPRLRRPHIQLALFRPRETDEPLAAPEDCSESSAESPSPARPPSADETDQEH